MKKNPKIDVIADKWNTNFKELFYEKKNFSDDELIRYFCEIQLRENF